VSVIALPDFSFPTIEFALMHLREPLDSLARSLGFVVQAWDEESLGAVRGAFLRLPSGRVLLLRESLHEKEVHGAIGPMVLVDADTLGAVGPKSLILEVLDALGLHAAQTAWQQQPGIQERAARIADWSRAYLEAKRRGLALPEYPP
jgi:hypothetical protein